MPHDCTFRSRALYAASTPAPQQHPGWLRERMTIATIDPSDRSPTRTNGKLETAGPVKTVAGAAVGCAAAQRREEIQTDLVAECRYTSCQRRAALEQRLLVGGLLRLDFDDAWALRQPRLRIPSDHRGSGTFPGSMRLLVIHRRRAARVRALLGLERQV